MWREDGSFALQQRTEGLHWRLVHSDKSGEIRKLQDEQQVLPLRLTAGKAFALAERALEANALTLQLAKQQPS
ncbi:unnamed protein product [Phytophthora fragariaefolia]|uniref:Unnamed protein product n=1 Tax=Phytophthora fragariaefolia TaxID=1490495 RepID=A0A9W6XT31_9STRA|nr:unnamed protein product [Phytophthora fragariaefolia]